MNLLQELREISCVGNEVGAVKIFEIVSKKHEKLISEIVEKMREVAKSKRTFVYYNFIDRQTMIDVEFYFEHLHFKTNHLMISNGQEYVLEISWRY